MGKAGEHFGNPFRFLDAMRHLRSRKGADLVGNITLGS